ncbi:hypothetical protein [Maritalea sp. S77]|uniref:hypothetical protein n=1 Tax=Maritalea sp. S77 TaxID=3415125 RepID=UPI003C7A5932
MVGDLNSVFLPEDSKILRQPISPEIPRSDQFMAEFDQRGIFYSVFRDISGKRVWFLGPELMNLKAEVLPIWVEGNRSGRRKKLRFIKNNHAIVGYANLPETDDEAKVEIAGHTLNVGIGENFSEANSGSRIVYCISKDNDLKWIADWAHFYVKEHAADTFVIFDNNSTAYTTQDIESALNEVPGVKRAIAINWPFKFGVLDPVAQSQHQRCQILFAQRVAHMELFLRYGMFANSILNVDIDELVVSTERNSIFEVVERRFFGCLKFERYLVENVREPQITNDLPSFREFYFRNKNHLSRQDQYKKWIIAPSKLRRISKAPILWTHRIYGVINPYPVAKEFKCYHFAGITCDWRKNDDMAITREWQHERNNRVIFDNNLHVKDVFLERVLRDVFLVDKKEVKVS